LTKDKKITPLENKERSEKQMNNSIVAELPGIDKEFPKSQIEMEM